MDESKELRDSIQEVREWLIRIDTKLEVLSDTKEQAAKAEETAKEALQLSKHNKESITSLQTSQQRNWFWLITTSILFLLGIISTFISK